MGNQSVEQVDPQIMANWSNARLTAWSTFRSHPNRYLYRFNMPQEQQRMGPFTSEEHKLFMQRVHQLGANNNWGIFSMTIPGRVGYQCGEYWRQLMRNGSVHDPNYYLQDGRFRFHRSNGRTMQTIPMQYRKFAFTVIRDQSNEWENLPKKHPNHPSEELCKEVQKNFNQTSSENSAEEQ